MRAGPLLAALLALAAPAAVGQGDDLRAAREAKAQGRLDEAIERYRAVLGAEPGDAQVLGELAQALAWQGRFDEAIEAYERAVALAPGDDSLRLGLARTLSWARRYEPSLAIYDAYLGDHPDDEAVRLEAAKVRSWSGDYAAAVAVYRSYLEAHPDDRAWRLELAKVLSWSERYPESIEEFRALVAGDPDDREARLGLARVLSWAGRYDESVAEYGELLRRDPGDPEAQIGLARTLAWSGDWAGAGDRYDAILAGRPEDAQALLGKAQIAWWRGEARESERLLARAEAAAPEDPEVAAFRRAMRRERRPFLDTSYRHFQDTDGNDTKYLAASVALRPWGAGPSLTPFYERTEAFQGRVEANSCVPSFEQQPGSTAAVDTLGLRAAWALRGGIGLVASAAGSRSDPTVGPSAGHAVGSVAAFGPFARAWRWRGGIERRVFDATRVIVDCDITYDALTGGADGTWKKWRFGGGAGFTSFSDGNDRLHLDLSATRPLEFGKHSLDLGYRFRYMGYAENLADGYFDPQWFVSNLLVANARGPLFHPRVDYAALLTVGLQSFENDASVVAIDGAAVTLPAEEATGETVFGWELRIGWNITDRARLEGWYGETDYALTSATGFESQASGLLFQYRF